MSQNPSRFDVSSVNGVQQCDCHWIVDVTFSYCSFVLGQSRAKVSAAFTNVSGLAVATFDLVNCSLSVLRFVFVLDISKQSS